MNWILLFTLIFSLCHGKESFCYFTSPQKWNMIHPSELSCHVKIGFVTEGKKGFHPSLNLALEPVSLSLADYVQKVKEIHKTDRNKEWRDLGKFQTAAGEGRLTEIKSKTEWGTARMLQLLFIKGDTAYVLTACALKEEFSAHYGAFQEAFRSLNVVQDPLESLIHSSHKEAFETLINNYRKQAISWDSVQKMVLEDFSEMGTCWQIFTLKSLASSKDLLRN